MSSQCRIVNMFLSEVLDVSFATPSSQESRTWTMTPRVSISKRSGCWDTGFTTRTQELNPKGSGQGGVSCGSPRKGWDPLSADGRQLVWHVRKSVHPDSVIYEPSTVQTMLDEKISKTGTQHSSWMDARRTVATSCAKHDPAQSTQASSDTAASMTAWTLSEFQRVSDPRLKPTIGRCGGSASFASNVQCLLSYVHPLSCRTTSVISAKT